VSEYTKPGLARTSSWRSSFEAAALLGTKPFSHHHVPRTATRRISAQHARGIPPLPCSRESLGRGFGRLLRVGLSALLGLGAGLMRF